MSAPQSPSPNSPLSRAEQALATAQQEVEAAAESVHGADEPGLEDELSETADVLEDRQAALCKAAAVDEADVEESDAAAQRPDQLLCRLSRAFSGAPDPGRHVAVRDTEIGTICGAAEDVGGDAAETLLVLQGCGYGCAIAAGGVLVEVGG